MGLLSWLTGKDITNNVLKKIRAGADAPKIINAFRDKNSLPEIKAAIINAANQYYEQETARLEDLRLANELTEANYIALVRIARKRKDSLIGGAEALIPSR